MGAKTDSKSVDLNNRESSNLSFGTKEKGEEENEYIQGTFWGSIGNSWF